MENLIDVIERFWRVFDVNEDNVIIIYVLI